MQKLAETLSGCPTLRSALETAETNRTSRMRILIQGPFAVGLEEFLADLQSYENAFRAKPALESATCILERVRRDYETAVDAWLSGAHAVVLDLMRGVMEAEYLFDDFAARVDAVREWASMTEKDRRRLYSPAKLRERRASRRGRQPAELMDAKEYSLHSVNLHVTPHHHWFAPRGFWAIGESFGLAICLAEMLEHARRFIITAENLKAMAVGKASGSRDFMRETPDFFRAWEATQLQMEVYMQLTGQSGEIEILDEGPVNLLEVLRKAEARKIVDRMRSTSDAAQGDNSEDAVQQ